MNITNQIIGKIISIRPLNKPITGISITGTKKYRKIPCVLNSFNISGSVGLKVFIVKMNLFMLVNWKKNYITNKMEYVPVIFTGKKLLNSHSQVHRFLFTSSL